MVTREWKTPRELQVPISADFLAGVTGAELLNIGNLYYAETWARFSAQFAYGSQEDAARAQLTDAEKPYYPEFEGLSGLVVQYTPWSPAPEFGLGGGGQVLPSIAGADPEMPEIVIPVVPGLIPPGGDLRDYDKGSEELHLLAPIAAGAVSLSAILRLLGAGAGPVRSFFWGVAGGAVRTWNSFPGWLQTILLTVGVARGTSIVMDLLDSDGAGAPGVGFMGLGAPGVSVLGTWTANGVKFYRLSDGRLAVQNKIGRWKVWRPKRPIVLMPGGANNLRVLIKADTVLNRQAKKIATMLNRRAKARPRGRLPASGMSVIAQDGVKISRT